MATSPSISIISISPAVNYKNPGPGEYDTFGSITWEIIGYEPELTENIYNYNHASSWNLYCWGYLTGTKPFSPIDSSVTITATISLSKKILVKASQGSLVAEGLSLNEAQNKCNSNNNNVQAYFIYEYSQASDGSYSVYSYDIEPNYIDLGTKSVSTTITLVEGTHIITKEGSGSSGDSGDSGDSGGDTPTSPSISRVTISGDETYSLTIGESETINYSISISNDNGTITPSVKVKSSDAAIVNCSDLTKSRKSGSFKINALSEGTAIITVKVDNSKTDTITVNSISKAKAYIGDQNGIARKITKAYIGIDNLARKIKKIYVGDSNNKAKLIYKL